MPIVAHSKVVWAGPQHLQDLLVELGFPLLQGEMALGGCRSPAARPALPHGSWPAGTVTPAQTPARSIAQPSPARHSPGSHSASRSQRFRSRTAPPAPCRCGWPPPTSAAEGPGCGVNWGGKGTGCFQSTQPLLQGNCSSAPAGGAGRVPGVLQQGSSPAIVSHGAPCQASPLWGAKTPHISPGPGLRLVQDGGMESWGGCREEPSGPSSLPPAWRRAAPAPSRQ